MGTTDRTEVPDPTALPADDGAYSRTQLGPDPRRRNVRSRSHAAIGGCANGPPSARPTSCTRLRATARREHPEFTETQIMRWADSELARC
jgi:hypothetical protein